MNTTQHFKAAQALSAVLGIVGLMLIGMGFGEWLSIQTLLSEGCAATQLPDPTPCQAGIQTMGTRSTRAALIGVFALLSGGGIVVYLRWYVP
jgi:hypothetical protein